MGILQYNIDIDVFEDKTTPPLFPMCYVSAMTTKTGSLGFLFFVCTRWIGAAKARVGYSIVTKSGVSLNASYPMMLLARRITF